MPLALEERLAQSPQSLRIEAFIQNRMARADKLHNLCKDLSISQAAAHLEVPVTWLVAALAGLTEIPEALMDKAQSDR